MSDFRGSVNLSTNGLIADLERIEANVDRNRDKISGFDTLEMTYEELIGTPDSTLSRILNFLQISGDFELRSNLQKIMPSDLSNVIENWDEVRSTLTCTRFEHLLQDIS